MASSSTRLIDQIPTPASPCKVEVLALGLSRTSTYSLFIALGILGYKPYHASELKDTPAGTHALWIEALEAKFHSHPNGPHKNNSTKIASPPQPYAKPEFDKLLAEYSAITDIPCIMFTEELLAAYPSAKVLLTLRDEDSWVRSVRGLFNTLLRWNWSLVWSHEPLFPQEKAFHIRGYIRIIEIAWNIWTGGDWDDEEALRRTFREHYAKVRALVPRERLLEFDAREGWGPLCGFLRKEVPEGEYPRLNDLGFTIWFHKQLWWAAARKTVVEKVKGRWGLGFVGMGAVVAWYSFY
ncbi:MAG: hypothetical protein L6R41_004041 [Letrouitia leprolyta]|nr:MAG: hypothetical protein L6R41_004041 [Letrouitia leprolyta]